LTPCDIGRKYWIAKSKAAPLEAYRRDIETQQSTVPGRNPA
jgi:hypothetical protein